jgi:hypothetical protein
MKEYRRLRAEQPTAAKKSANKDPEEDEQEEEPAEETDPDAL